MNERQEQLELEARERGAHRVRKLIEKAERDERAAETPGGVALTKRAIEPLSNAIRASIADANSGRAGRRQLAVRLLEKIDPEVAAYLAIKEIISSAIRGNPINSTAIKIASSIEDELRLAAFEEKEPGLYHLLDRRNKERGGSPDHARALFVFTANKFKMELPTFTRTEKVHLGVKLIDLFIETTGFVEHVNVRRGKKLLAILRPVGHVEDWIKDQNVRAEFLRPYYLPTVKEPKPWTGVKGGGYHTAHLLERSLVKAGAKPQMDALAGADMAPVYTGLNAIQNTGWRINKKVLAVMVDVWERGAEIAMPNREDLDLPPRPADIDTNDEARKQWRIAARRVHETNATSRGKRLSLAMLIEAAKHLQNDEVLYFPHQLDFRGRAYAMPVGLNPQGQDQARALLTFAQGKPITEPRAAGWLAIHGANLFGYDKVGFEDRIAWSEDRLEQIHAVAEDPLGNLWWTEADKPWSFLAWCFEFSEFHKTGYGFVSSLPISVDGSCNGLQHFSAMLRDPVGGCAVNLLPTKKPADIYQRVADVVIERLREEIASDGEKAWIARSWIDFGIDRKITKRAVMVLPYGGTFRACLEYVREAVNEKIEAGVPNPFGTDIGTATAYLAQIVWHSISNVVTAARKAMDWLQKVARIAAKHQLPLKWTTPSGFIAYQAYRDVKVRQVKTRLQGSLVYLSQNERSQRLDPRKQALGISPNFVHSLDAAAMMLTIELALNNGVTQFAMIHDSYGTVAADMDMLGACLREAFIQIYEGKNVLQSFLDELPEEVRKECPPLPSMGTLDVTAVRHSDFFFA